MRRWWAGLSARDQRIVRWGGSLAVLLLAYSLLWEPLLRERDAWRARAIAADQALLWMREAAPQVQGRAQVSQAPLDGRSLLARVDAGAREAGLGGVLLRVEPLAHGQVRAYFEGAPFDRLMQWLQPLGASQSIRVEELSIQRASGVGLVNARFTLVDAAR